MAEHVDDQMTSMINLAGDCAGPADTRLLMPVNPGDRPPEAGVAH